MKKHMLSLGALSIVALPTINVISCGEVNINDKVKKELGYLNSDGKPNLELKLNLKDGKVFETINFKPIKDFIEINKIKNTDIESFITKQLKITDENKFDTISEKFDVDKVEFNEKSIKADKSEIKGGKVTVEFYQEKTIYGKKRIDLKDFTIDATTIKNEILDKISADDIKITSIDKPKANFEAKINQKTDFTKLL